MFALEWRPMMKFRRQTRRFNSFLNIPTIQNSKKKKIREKIARVIHLIYRRIPFLHGPFSKFKKE